MVIIIRSPPIHFADSFIFSSSSSSILLLQICSQAFISQKYPENDDGIRFFYGNSTDEESMGISTSSAMMFVIQMGADQLQKEFQEHQRRISSDRMVSMEKGGDRNSLRGKLYDKYMEKRVARLKMEQGSKRAAMNEANLRALRDDLERCRMELQGMVVSSKDVGLGARQRLQSINVWSSQMTEELRQIDILRPEEDDDLTKYFCQREKMESMASARDELLQISRSHKPRKDFLVRHQPSSSLARPIVLPVPRPSNKLTRSSSSRKRFKPENLLLLRKENAKPPPVISRKTNHSIARSSVQTSNASEDLQKSRSSLKKSSTSPLGYRKSMKGKVKELKKGIQSFDVSYWMSFKSEYLTGKAKPRTIVFEPRNNNSHGSLSFHADNVDVLAMRLDEEESDRDLLENFSKSIDLDPFPRNASAANSGKTTSFILEKEQDFGNLTIGMDDAGYSGKISSYVMRNVEKIGFGHSTVATEGPKDSATEKAHEDCFGVNVVNPKSSKESDDSGNFESTDDDTSRSLSCVELSMNSASELPNSTRVKNFKVFGTKSLNGIPSTCETAPAAGDAKSPEADTNPIRRKIRNPPKSVPPAANCSYCRSQMGVSIGYKRFPKFCKRSRGNESSADWVSTTTSEGDEEIFTKSLVLEEQGSISHYDSISSAKQNLPIVTECVRLNRFFSIAVPSLHFSILSPLERIKQKGGYLSGRSLKATRSFLSLSSLRCRRDDTNPRQPIPRE